MEDRQRPGQDGHLRWEALPDEDEGGHRLAALGRRPASMANPRLAVSRRSVYPPSDLLPTADSHSVPAQRRATADVPTLTEDTNPFEHLQSSMGRLSLQSSAGITGKVALGVPRGNFTKEHMKGGKGPLASMSLGLNSRAPPPRLQKSSTMPSGYVPQMQTTASVPPRVALNRKFTAKTEHEYSKRVEKHSARSRSASSGSQGSESQESWSNDDDIELSDSASAAPDYHAQPPTQKSHTRPSGYAPQMQATDPVPSRVPLNHAFTMKPEYEYSKPVETHRLTTRRTSFNDDEDYYQPPIQTTYHVSSRDRVIPRIIDTKYKDPYADSLDGVTFAKDKTPLAIREHERERRDRRERERKDRMAREEREALKLKEAKRERERERDARRKQEVVDKIRARSKPFLELSGYSDEEQFLPRSRAKKSSSPKSTHRESATKYDDRSGTGGLHNTISRDSSADESVRQAKLLADMGKRSQRTRNGSGMGSTSAERRTYMEEVDEDGDPLDDTRTYASVVPPSKDVANVPRARNRTLPRWLSESPY